MNLEAYLPELRQIFGQHRVILAYLFGSQATGLAGPLSDVDVAVLLSPDVPRGAWTDVQIDLIVALSGLLQRSDVDVVILNRAPPLLAYEVARDGRIIYEGQEQPRVAFEVKALREYSDTIPLRRIQYYYLAKWVEMRKSQRAKVGGSQ